MYVTTAIARARRAWLWWLTRSCLLLADDLKSWYCEMTHMRLKTWIHIPVAVICDIGAPRSHRHHIAKGKSDNVNRRSARNATIRNANVYIGGQYIAGMRCDMAWCARQMVIRQCRETGVLSGHIEHAESSKQWGIQIRALLYCVMSSRIPHGICNLSSWLTFAKQMAKSTITSAM